LNMFFIFLFKTSQASNTIAMIRAILCVPHGCLIFEHLFEPQFLVRMSHACSNCAHQQTRQAPTSHLDKLLNSCNADTHIHMVSLAQSKMFRSGAIQYTAHA
jgi:hypothetical protein